MGAEDPGHPESPDNAEAIDLRLVFREVNEHLRTTELKQLQISVGYMAMLSVGLPLLESRGTLKISYASLALFGLLSVIGCVVHLAQRWYRVWKEHYIEVAYCIARTRDADDKFLPYWLRKREPNSKPKRVAWSLDNVIPAFTLCATTATFAVDVWLLHGLFANPWVQIPAMLCTSALFLGFLYESHTSRGHPPVERLAHRS